ANPSVDRDKIMVLGGGPNRIGQGIEFDYCCVHASLALREDGYQTSDSGNYHAAPHHGVCRFWSRKFLNPYALYNQKRAHFSLTQ
ncbi:hypothetical protein MJM99_32100, partial [Salmonella enterica subsp. enterica serovar Kentucky]|nr:hypothetical protein [Salmonella enterica subsp. enterica serovar Kentucky]